MRCYDMQHPLFCTTNNTRGIGARIDAWNTMEIDRTLVDKFRSIDELINRMQQLCRQHGFHSKHLRLNQCYSVYYYLLSCHAYRLFYQSTAVMTL